MNFEALQKELASLNKDDRTEWILAGDSNKSAINAAVEEVFRKFVNTKDGKEIMTSPSVVAVPLSGLVGTLPDDYYEITNLSVKSLGHYVTLDRDEFPYSVRFDATLKKYVMNVEADNIQTVYLRYVPTSGMAALSANGDVPALPPLLHRSIADFALVEYFRQNLDWQSVGNALQYAEGKFSERISQIWTE